ncbi:MAG: DUF2779 domain-containing protein, partial [bacterium]|nr:DUF2779 domain-containing protein [bacterium]
CDKESIKRELNSFQYPLYYFDYETFNPAVPLFDGLHPYQQMPFQYSLHIQKTPEASVEHKYFLATEKVNSIPDLLAQLQRDLGDKGTILVWYQAFEKGRNEEMAKMYPEYAGFIRSVNDERIYDLMSIFKSSLFRKKEFGKSSSLKVVAPVLVPELPYTELNIQEGGKASESWLELVDGNLSQVEKDDLYDDMLKYCERDTEVMVRILKFLIKITKISF